MYKILLPSCLIPRTFHNFPMERLKILFLLLLLILFSTVTSSPQQPQQWRRPTQRNRQLQKNGLPLHVVNASNTLCFALLQQLSSEGNTFLSPLGISMSMGMVYLGAKNRTAAEMSRILGYEKMGLTPENVHLGYKRMYETLKKSGGDRGRDEPYSLEIANALLIEKGFRMHPEYKEKARQIYDAAVETISFSLHPEVALESVNGWAAWKTRNKIKQVLTEPLDPLTKLFLLNAVYFKGTWKTKFDQRLTMPDTFYNAGKIPKTVPMMRQKKKFNYGFVVQLQSQALELPYDGDDIRMLILLPEKRDGLPELESKLTHRLVDEIPKNLREVTVQVILPRFTLEEEYDMIALFKTMGMNALFNPYTADLSGIADGKGLYVTKIVHKSVVDVNEEGSEAATITGVAAGVRTGGPLHPSFTADHPFIFFIRDIRTNVILFTGRVNVF